MVDDRRGAVHRGQDADEIASACLAVGAQIALERGALGLRQQGHGPRVLAERGVALEVDQIQIVSVDMVAGLDVAGRHADDGVVLAHRRARRDATGGNLVAAGHLGAHAQAQLRDGHADGQGLPGDQHIVVGVQPDQGVGVHRGISLSGAFLSV
ncbi:hypothetical protein D3C71_1645040 [compost metagenome]